MKFKNFKIHVIYNLPLNDSNETWYYRMKLFLSLISYHCAITHKGVWVLNSLIKTKNSNGIWMLMSPSSHTYKMKFTEAKPKKIILTVKRWGTFKQFRQLLTCQITMMIKIQFSILFELLFYFQFLFSLFSLLSSSQIEFDISIVFVYRMMKNLLLININPRKWKRNILAFLSFVSFVSSSDNNKFQVFVTV